MEERVPHGAYWKGLRGPLLLPSAAIVAGFVAAFFVSGWDIRVFQVVTGDSLLPKIQLWLVLIMAQAALWIACIVYMASALIWLNRSVASPKPLWISASLALASPVLVLLFIGAKQSLYRTPIPPAKIGAFSIVNLPRFGSIGMLVAAFAVWEMYVVTFALKSEFDVSARDWEIKRFVELRENMLRLLSLASVVLALGTLAGAALRNAVNADKGSTYFPREYVVIYGAVFSLVLFAAYAPVYASFFSIGVRLREHLIGKPPDTVVEFKEWKERRDAINEALGLNLSGASALGGPLSALLPVISGWAATLLQVKT